MKLIFIISCFIFSIINAKDLTGIFTGEKYTPAGGLTDECAIFFAHKISENIFNPVKELIKDYEQVTDFFYWGRLIRAFEAADEAKIKDLFNDDFKPSDLANLVNLIRGGYIKVTSKEEAFIEDLYHVVDDNGPIFWIKDNPRHEIVETLRKIDKRWGTLKGRDESALFTIKSLNEAEEAVLQRGLGEHKGEKFENSKWYQKFYRYFSPHYRKILNILDHNNFLRKRAQLIYKMDDPFHHALSFAGKIALTQPLQYRLKARISDTGAQLSDIRDDIKKIYGQELSQSSRIQKEALNIRDLHKSIMTNHSIEDYKKTTSQAESDMDELESVMNEAWTVSGNKGLFPLKDYTPFHFQVRFLQYGRETGEFYNKYLEITKKHPKNSNYNIKVSRSITESWTTVESDGTDEKGRPKTKVVHHSASYTQTKPFIAHASYEEILKGQIKADPDEFDMPSWSPYHWGASVSYGSNYVSDEDTSKMKIILESGKKVRASESPFRQRLDEAIGQLETISNDSYKEILTDPQKHEQILKELDKTKRELEELRIKFSEYKDMNPNQISEQWKDDIPQDFYDRNNMLDFRYQHMIRRIEFLHEQIIRKINIDYEQWDIPDRSNEVEEFRKIWLKYRISQGIIGGVAGISTGGYFYFKDEIDDKLFRWKKDFNKSQIKTNAIKQFKKIKEVFNFDNKKE